MPGPQRGQSKRLFVAPPQQQYKELQRSLDKVESELIPVIQRMLKRLYPQLLEMIPASVKKAKKLATEMDDFMEENFKIRNALLSKPYDVGVRMGSSMLYSKLKKQGVSEDEFDEALNQNKVFSTGFKALQEYSRMSFIDAANTLQDDARLYIKNALDKGMVYTDIADGLKDILGYDEPWRAERIARTESNWAANQGIKKASEELNIKKFTVNLSPSACETCVSEVGGGATFDIGEVDALLPVHPNCRCTANPVIPDDWDIDDYL